MLFVPFKEALAASVHLGTKRDLHYGMCKQSSNRDDKDGLLHLER